MSQIEQPTPQPEHHHKRKHRSAWRRLLRYLEKRAWLEKIIVIIVLLVAAGIIGVVVAQYGVAQTRRRMTFESYPVQAQVSVWNDNSFFDKGLRLI